MTQAKHTHLLHASGQVTEIDVWATHLALVSRGKRVLSGGTCGRVRANLARLLGDDALAELLRSGRPMRAEGVVNGYRFEEV